MKIIALDPGDRATAAVLIDAISGVPIETKLHFNENMKAWLVEQIGQHTDIAALVIEYTPPYTMSMGNGRSFVPSQVVDTAIEIGRFIENWLFHTGQEATLLSRIEVKKHLLGKTTGTDAMVRAALMDRFGGERLAKGSIKCVLCKGKGTFGVIMETCPACQGTNQVDGKRPGTKKTCPRCKAKGVVKGDAATCEACGGDGWSVPPGPMNGVTSHLYAALAVGLMYCDQNKLIQD